MSNRFEIRLIPEAATEYKQLDGSIRALVNIIFRKLEERADEMGSELFHTRNSKLIGCRKIKLKKHGIRIVYRILKDQLEIVQIIAIAKREDNEVYLAAHKRLAELKKRKEEK